MVESVEGRVARIHGSFKRSRLDAAGRSFWEHWSTENASFLVGMSLTVVTLALEPALWFDDWPPSPLDIPIPDSAALSLLLIFPLNGLFLDRFLATKTARETALPRWLLCVRFFAASLPLLGLFTLSAWRELLDRGSFRILEAQQAQPLSLSRHQMHLPSGIRWRRFYKSGVFFLWMATSFLPLLVWASWLMSTSRLGPRRSEVILGVCAILHLASSVFMALYVRSFLQSDRATGWRRGLFLTAPLLWLFALPGMFLGFALLELLNPSRYPMAWFAYARRTEASRIALWQGIQGTLRTQWQKRPWFLQWRRPTGLSNPEARGQADVEVLAFYRLKTLLLTLDSAALFAGVSWLAKRIPSLTTTLNTNIHWVTYSAIALALTGLLIQLTGVSARVLRVPALADRLSRHSYGRYLLLTQTAFLAGSQGAFLLISGNVEQFGVLLCLGSALCAITSVLFFMPKPAVRELMLWGFLFLSLSALGALVALHPEAALQSSIVFRTITALTPLWSLGLFLVLGDWLLRPFSWRHIIDSRLPLSLRAALVSVTVATLLPLGGVAIPFWIYARHRIWPRYESLLYEHYGGRP